MVAWEQIQGILDWIEDNYSKSIKMETLAKQANLSEFYFQRLFSKLVGRPVFEYIKLRRLNKAVNMIDSNPSEKIIDICLEAGFDNHETFTRAFKEAYGITPDTYRKNQPFLSHFYKPDLSLNYYLIDEGVPLIAEGIVLEINRRYNETPIHFSGYFIQNPDNKTPGLDTGENQISYVWEKITSELIKNNNKIPLLTVGVSFPGKPKGYFTYFCGVETESPKEGYEDFTIEAAEYIVFSFEAENFELLVSDALYKARDYMVGTWRKKKNLKLEPVMIEIYPKTGEDSCSMELWFKEM